MTDRFSDLVNRARGLAVAAYEKSNDARAQRDAINAAWDAADASPNRRHFTAEEVYWREKKDSQKGYGR